MTPPRYRSAEYAVAPIPLRYLYSVGDDRDPTSPPMRRMGTLYVDRATLLMMQPTEGLPRMRPVAYVTTGCSVHKCDAMGFGTLIDVMTGRPPDHKFAVVEVLDGGTWLIDMYDCSASADQMTLSLGRYRAFRTADAAIAAVAFGW